MWPVLPNRRGIGSIPRPDRCPFPCGVQARFVDEYLIDLNATAGRVSQNSGENEWYTPKALIEAARLSDGRQLTSTRPHRKSANRVVKATQFYSRQDGTECNVDLAKKAAQVWSGVGEMP